ncbi:alpha-2,8-polysialyltransferase family protein [Pontibacter arcticus]|uniref:CDP-Glycerol:Poly(Glycerophosphate) glycerophosphotransferase n=1 Tax=Pontibacter arcticus TaxID=2080288 RepID=A0A364RCY9_9BACT|nr:alpha-2,8-polysialyltransferase family protein [Pontibacter arcticus]RAU82220.1 hypothetical protein DP923_10515 [Pontibacter arcticus]
MPSKPKILFIGDYCRTDYVSLLKDAKNDIYLYFLFYTSPKEETNHGYQAYGQAIYWKNFKDVFALLHQIRPHKVVFLYIESYNHVILNLACRQLNIPTYLLEHGLRADYVFGFDANISPASKKNFIAKIKTYYKLTHNFIARIKSRLFLLNSIKLLPPEDKAFAKHFIKIRSKHNYLDTFRSITSEKRLAENYIGFSSKIYDAFVTHEAPYFSKKATFIGIPYFDALAKQNPAQQIKIILFIDQPLAEHSLLQWNNEIKKTFNTDLSDLCQKHNYQLYVKLHPKQETAGWEELQNQRKCLIINEETLINLAPSIPIVIGFYSTYLMPFAAFPHTTVITYVKHPAGNFPVSAPFVDAGVAHPIYELEELKTILPNIEALHRQQVLNKAKFTEEWMYKFDGKAGERLRDILLSDDL